jgi:predicted nucleotidyltransferase
MSINSNILEEISFKIKDLKEELAARYSVRSIGIFGSVVKGRYKRESDVDILVELNEPTFDHYMELKFRLEELLGCDVDLVLRDSIKPRLRSIIEKEVQYV